jgi:glycosyltransferase involved in cell wall biosynthesis
MTVITPSYNQGAFVGRTIESVLSQGYPNLEVLVVDGGSTDETLDILRTYEGEVRWISEKDRGQAHAINKGLRMATGEVIAFLNSDDLYEPGGLIRVGEFFARQPQAAWVTGKCRTIDERGVEIRKAITRYKQFWLTLRSYTVLLILNYISQPATFWRRKVVDEIGYLDETLHYTMDYEYWLRIGRRFRLWCLDSYLACFRFYAASKSGSTAHAQFDEELAVARRHTSARAILGLHTLHNVMAVAVYRYLLSRRGTAAVPPV